MIDHLVSALVSPIMGFISSAGYAGVAALMAIESACIPLPSEVIMPFAGYLVSIGRFNLFLVATVGAIGCNVGSTVAYAVAAKGGRPAFERWGSYVLVRPDELERAERFFARYGAATVFIGRLLPVVRTFIAFPAGLARMSMLKFQLYTFLGSWPWCLALAYIGYILGDRWHNDPTFRRLFHEFDLAVLVLIVAGVALFIWSRWPRKSNR
ncbi:MAG TPA: DedA family protein [Pseudolabrys sp.]|nr:DedA family protein [Pseudolabrys sp.]